MYLEFYGLKQAPFDITPNPRFLFHSAKHREAFLALAFLHERGQQRYDFVYAASSGACSAAYFVSGMWGPGLTIWRDQASKAVRKINLLRRKPIVDLAYLVDDVFRRDVPLSVEALQRAPTRYIQDTDFCRRTRNLRRLVD